jgi:hypothetical protein
MLNRMFLKQQGAPLFVEDVFSTYLYTGSSSAQTITNGIDLAGKGGLVWMKRRDAVTDHYLFDTNRGGVVSLATNSTSTGTNWGAFGVTYNSNGFTILSGFSTSATFASWTFREAPKFFDVVTYTGNGANRNIAHNLGSVPGMIIVKRTDAVDDWQVYHRSNANTQYMVLNNDQSVATGATRWNSTTPTATVFTVGTDTTVNASGSTYVAYLFAHETTSTGIIQCGSFTTDAGGAATVNLGWEPQWILAKPSSTTESWYLINNMQGFPVSGQSQTLKANTTAAENGLTILNPTATGFTCPSGGWFPGSATIVYMAIRRGPMKTPTLGTSVFSPNVSSASTGTTITTNFPVDFQFAALRGGGFSPFVMDRLRGVVTSSTAATMPYLNTGSTAAETLGNSSLYWDNTGYQMPSGFASNSDVFWNFRRAPSFFDEVCYTGTGVQISVPHNLGVVPEIIITKRRNSTGAWLVYTATTGLNNYLSLNTTDAVASATNYSAVSATAFNAPFNNSGGTFVSYLFASCPGVSKVGSYTGNGSSQTINCAFTTGARFVMIKRTDSTGDWYVWDSARGIVAGNDPYLALNSTAAEVTSNDSVDTDNTGFIVNQVAASNVNVNAATYIFLAIA